MASQTMNRKPGIVQFMYLRRPASERARILCELVGAGSQDAINAADELDRLFLLVESARAMAWAFDNGLEPDDISDGKAALFNLLEMIHQLLWKGDIHEIRDAFRAARRELRTNGGAR